MTQLIVALDVPVFRATALYDLMQAEVRNFKIGVPLLLESAGGLLAKTIVRRGGTLMLDLKAYDVADTIARIMDRVDQIGAHFVTVHIDAVRRAVQACPKSQIIAVNRLTDDGDSFVTQSLIDATAECAGAVCPPDSGWRMKKMFPEKTIICPGVRPLASRPDNHKWPLSPGEMAATGVDYIVVGRPIIAAENPVSVARQIMSDLGGGARLAA